MLLSVQSVSPPRISILISTIGGVDDLARCLESVLPQAAAPEIEVIVGGLLPAGQESEVRRRLPAQQREAFRCLNTGVEGFLEGYAAGAEAALGDWLLLLDEDAVVPPGFVSWLIKRVETDDAGILGFPQFPLEDDSYMARSLRYLDLALKRGMDRKIAINIAAMACRRSVYFDLGGFDPGSGLDIHSPAGFVTRARRRGLRIRYEAGAYLYDGAHGLGREVWLHQRALRSIDVSRGPGYYRLGYCLAIAAGLIAAAVMLVTKPRLFIATGLIGSIGGLAAMAAVARSVGAPATLAPGMLFGATVRAAFAMTRAGKYLAARAKGRSRG
ncbi:MAG: glycosyltransferase [Dehalococcoidia bacterium]|nr:glycosyltransferase [Dehalococcoidia bacterium]